MRGRVKRREFIALAGGAVVWPRMAHAQKSATPVVGFFATSSTPSDRPRVDAFVRRLRELDWVEGRTVAIEYRWLEGPRERLAEVAAELVRRNVDVIVTSGAALVLAAKRETSRIPIIFAIASDPVATGLVATLARPGGNVTGLSYLGPDLAAKRLELSRELVNRLTRLAIVANSDAAGAMLEMREVQAAAGTLGLEAIRLEVRNAEDISPAIGSLQGRAHALYVCADPLVNAKRKDIIALALGARLPTIFGERENIDAGGLMSYGPNVADMFRRAAELVDKVLRGAKPAEIPVEQPTKFELVFNLNTAKALGITIPPTLLARADEVIE